MDCVAGDVLYPQYDLLTSSLLGPNFDFSFTSFLFTYEIPHNGVPELISSQKSLTRVYEQFPLVLTEF